MYFFSKARNTERQLENERSTLKSMQEYTGSLEASLKDTALQAQSQVRVNACGKRG